MRRLIYCLMMGGAVLLVMGLFLLPTPPGVVVAQDFSDAEYIGRGECNDCHRDVDRAHRDSPHVLALQDVADEENKDAILGDFSQGDDIRTVLFPGESEPRPFTAADIVFAMGSGQHAQTYLVATGEHEYLVLPAEWNTLAQAWEPLALADAWPDPVYDFVTNCAGCHTTGLDASRGRWEDDGVECEACHGPGSTHADLVDDAGSSIDDEEVAAIRGAIAFTSDSQMCGQCHSRGTTPDG
ncbi:MAG: hypothetical protein KC496_21725, partial [Anaerolineae bacterium]|nr:hypothetical protein [Anaerolineae bacterium]